MEKLCASDYFSNVEYQDLCATINPSKIKDLEEQKQSLKQNMHVYAYLRISILFLGPTCFTQSVRKQTLGDLQD